MAERGEIAADDGRQQAPELVLRMRIVTALGQATLARQAAEDQHPCIGRRDGREGGFAGHAARAFSEDPDRSTVALVGGEATPALPAAVPFLAPDARIVDPVYPVGLLARNPRLGEPLRLGAAQRVGPSRLGTSCRSPALKWSEGR